MPLPSNLHRASHVGSFLRPTIIHESRKANLEGKLSSQELRKVEDEEIAKLIEKQRANGIKTLSDGEFRREYFHLDFLQHVGGVSIIENTLPAGDKRETIPPKLSVTGKLEHVKPIQLDDFLFLQKLAKPDEVVKVALPSPTMAHFRGGRKGIAIDAYPELDAFFEDLAKVWRAELKSLTDAGCKYIQLDDTNLAYLADEDMRKAAAGRGEDLNTLPLQYASLINDCVRDVPDDVTVAVHLCRGNFRSTHFAKGGYEPVAQVLFQELDVDVYYLEFDDDRSGSFEPLRFLPPPNQESKAPGKRRQTKDKVIVLGVISSKVPQLESPEAIKARLEDATKWVEKVGGKTRLAVSPQCGFASTVHGNDITEDDQWNKMRLVVSVAKDFWGEA